MSLEIPKLVVVAGLRDQEPRKQAFHTAVARRFEQAGFNTSVYFPRWNEERAAGDMLDDLSEIGAEFAVGTSAGGGLATLLSFEDPTVRRTAAISSRFTTATIDGYPGIEQVRRDSPACADVVKQLEGFSGEFTIMRHLSLRPRSGDLRVPPQAGILPGGTNVVFSYLLDFQQN